jgi:thiamine biosynthesis lipoprotein
MPLVETLPVDARTAQWSLWSTTARVVVTDPGRLGDAEALVRQVCEDVERACSRFRPDAEIAALARAGGRPVAVTSTLFALLAAAVDAARRTDGDVDPTVGRALGDLGYDRDLAELARPRARGNCAPSDRVRIVVRRRRTWRDVELGDGFVRAPPGVELDLGATAKAWAADRSAALVARGLDGVGVLVGLGGDIATAGPAPAGGQVLVQDGPDQPADTVTLPAGTAMATSSTISRQWARDSRVLHHIVDPATGMPAEPVLRTASVAAPACVEANTLSTAALVRGSRARSLLAASGRPSRLVTRDGEVVRLGGWPLAQTSREDVA